MTYHISNEILNNQKYMEKLVIEINKTFNQHNINIYDEAIEFETNNIIDDIKLIEIFNLFPNTSQFKLSILKFKETNHLNLFFTYTPNSYEFTSYTFLSVDFIMKLKNKQPNNELICYEGIIKADLLRAMIKRIKIEEAFNVLPLSNRKVPRTIKEVNEAVEEIIKENYLDLYKGELFINKSQIKSLKDLAKLKEDIQYLFEK